MCGRDEPNPLPDEYFGRLARHFIHKRHDGVRAHNASRHFEADSAGRRPSLYKRGSYQSSRVTFELFGQTERFRDGTRRD